MIMRDFDRLQRLLARAPRGVRIVARRTARLAWWAATGRLVRRLRSRLASPAAVIPESARPPEIDYALKIPLRHVSVPTPADGPVAAIIHLYFPELAVEFRGY